MSIALDLGTHELRSLRRRHDSVVGRKCCTAYAVLPDTASRRRVLQRMNIAHAVCEGSLLVVGDNAVEYAQSFQTPCLPLMPESRVPTGDAPARQVLAALVEGLLPEPSEAGELCCLTLPGVPRRNRREADFLTRIVRLKGFEPIELGRGLAIVLSELVRDSFTGIGIDFGAGTTDVSVVHRGVEIDRHTVNRGGDWIDKRLAREFREHAWDTHGHRYLDTDSTRIWKESRSSIIDPADDREQFLGEVYTELVVGIIEDAATHWQRNDRLQRLPAMNVVCAGGVSRIPGFDALVTGIWNRADLPIATAGLRVVPSSRYTVARGCLINAELETETRRRNEAA